MSALMRVFKRGYKTVRDGELVQTLRSEIKQEQSLDQFKGHKVGALGNFDLSWDDQRSKDVLLRRKFDSGEEIAVSALLGSFNYGGDKSLPFQGLMKICIKKPELSSILLFDCVIANEGPGLSEFTVRRSCYLQLENCLEESVYQGPVFSDLDPQLQAKLKEYLIERGFGKDLINFLIVHLHQKEKDQYVKWLGKVEAILSKDE